MTFAQLMVYLVDSDRTESPFKRFKKFGNLGEAIAFAKENKLRKVGG